MDSGFSLPLAQQLGAFFGNDAPRAEAVNPTPGEAPLVAREDHRHPRLTSATVQTLGQNGEATVDFTRTFAALPAVTCLLYETTPGQPVVFKVKGWVQDASGAYTGCVVQGVRASVLPALSGIALLTGLVTALANYNVFGGSAAGAQFCCIALQPST